MERYITVVVSKTLWKLMSPTKPRVLKAEARSEQSFKRSDTEFSGKEEVKDEFWSMRCNDWEEIKNNVSGVRSLTDEMPGGIVTPELAMELSRIS